LLPGAASGHRQQMRAKGYSAFGLLRGALGGQRHWRRAWRNPEPQPRYDIIVVGGGGHGLATAYYLAKNHKLNHVAVIEKGWIGGGNTGRNTTIIRSNYLLRANALFYEWALKLWEGLSADLNFNVMFSPRGVLNLAHSDAQMDQYARRGNAMRLNGIDAELLDRAAVRRMVPDLDFSSEVRFPIQGGLLQRRGGTARHDAVAWGYARAADALGVDIIQNCEVNGFIWSGETVCGVETSRGHIYADRVGLAVAGHTSHVAKFAELTLPIETHVLQAFVTEPIKPLIDGVVTYGAEHFYISQSDKGGLVFGGDLDGYNSYAQRGSLAVAEHAIGVALAMFPMLGRLRLLRSWSGMMDMTMDGSPLICATPVEGLFINGGWCYGGFKATPASGWTFAHTLATGRPHTLNAPFTLERFERGSLLDEKGVGATPNAH
jgi:methylglutamate dehydrogenase subunit A